MTLNKDVFDISVVLVPYTKIFTCNSVLLCIGIYAYIKTSMFWEKPPNINKQLLVFHFLNCYLHLQNFIILKQANITSFPWQVFNLYSYMHTVKKKLKLCNKKSRTMSSDTMSRKRCFMQTWKLWKSKHKFSTVIYSTFWYSTWMYIFWNPLVQKWSCSTDNYRRVIQKIQW